MCVNGCKLHTRCMKMRLVCESYNSNGIITRTSNRYFVNYFIYRIKALKMTHKNGPRIVILFKIDAIVAGFEVLSNEYFYDSCSTYENPFELYLYSTYRMGVCVLRHKKAIMCNIQYGRIRLFLHLLN